MSISTITHLDSFYRGGAINGTHLARFKEAEASRRSGGARRSSHCATERHESRRIDNSCAARYEATLADSKFSILQDDLLRIFGGERMQKMMLPLGWKRSAD